MQEIKPVNILAVQPYGRINGFDDISSGAIGSIGRLLWTAMLINAGVIPKQGLLVLFPQGFSKESPTISTEKHQVSLGQMMADHFQSLPGMSNLRIIHKPLSWGTANDIEYTKWMADEEQVVRGHVHFVSDPVHIWRVEQIWNAVKPTLWEASFYGSPFHRMTAIERRIREPLARARYCLFDF